MPARWYALDLASQPVGPAFEARDRREAYDLGCALFGARCLMVQSVVSWEASEVERARDARRRRLREAADGDGLRPG